MKEFSTISSESIQNEIVINKSRFIGYACGISSVNEAVAFLESIRKKNYDATHNCYAYVFDGYMKFSDDGEPSQTAGKPILDVILKKNLTNLCVVVTRYFGGVKLGAGGLTRAYSNACGEVLKIAKVLEYRECVELKVNCDYSLLKSVQAYLQRKGKLIETVFDVDVSLMLLALVDREQQIIDDVTNITNGKAAFVVIRRYLTPFEE